MPKNLTFADLPAKMAKRLGQPDLVSKTSLPNATSTLWGFARALDLDKTAKVGVHLRDGYRDSIVLLREKLRRAGMKQATINNQVSLLNKWHFLVRLLDHEGDVASGGPTKFQQKLDGMFATHGAAAWKLVRTAGIAHTTMQNWRKGATPKYTSDAALQRLAVACKERPDAFTALLPFSLGRRKHVPSTSAPVPNREHHKTMVAAENRYMLRPHEVYSTDEVTGEVLVCLPFFAEWRGFVEHKVPMARVLKKALLDPMAAGIPKSEVAGKTRFSTNAQHGKSSVLERIQAAKQDEPENGGKTWRLRPAEDYPSEYADWVSCVGDSIAPTAGINYSYVAGYLGWLRLSPERGGKGMRLEDLSMAYLVDTQLLDDFIDWRGVRSNAVNSGLLNMLRNVRSYTAADTGYLWTSVAIGKRAGYEPVEWREKCFQVHSWLYRRLGQLFPLAETSRDPAVPLKHLLDLERPLEGFRNAINTFASEARSHSRLQATKARDLALLSLSISNPLRLTNLRLLTYRPDNTGHIRKGPKGWECAISRDEFKNIHGAARDRDYRQPLSPMAAKYFEEYIDGHWQRLGGGKPGDRGLIFIATGKPNTVWANMAYQYGLVTQRWLASAGCPSLRTHATRYLVGTAIIMATKGDVELAAGALHDMKRTVEKFYKKLLDMYTSRGVLAAIGKDLAIEEDMGGLVEIPDRASLPVGFK